MHLVGNSEQPPQLLNVETFRTSSDKRFDHLLFFLLETKTQIPTVINASHIVAEIFHDYGIHHSICEFKTFQTKLFDPYRLSIGRKYFANDVYDSLSHPMPSISHFNSRQTTIAERLLNISSIRGGTYFKYTDIQYFTVDQLTSKTIILSYQSLLYRKM